MSKWCFNYDSGEYEYIEQMASASQEANMFIIGTTVITAVKKRKNGNTMRKIGK